MRQSLSRFFSALCLLSLSHIANADVLVLVHGYLSDANAWHRSGVMAQLQQAGWQDAGVLQGTPQGVRLLAAPAQISGAQVVYRANLPALSTVEAQANVLQALLVQVRQQHPQDKLIMVGHSAGGVVARAVLVRAHAPKVDALITLSTPHLGTGAAEAALDITDIPFPLSVIADFVAGDSGYGVLRDSFYILRDLVREAPGNYLFWLNRQAHPAIPYYAVVHYGYAGLVPPYSQDISRVPALRDKQVHLWAGVGIHGLSPQDGQSILAILTDMAK
jgi:pimeloyl-ACP methyl ester carboxylesterase